MFSTTRSAVPPPLRLCGHPFPLQASFQESWILARGDHPNFEKKRSENLGWNFGVQPISGKEKTHKHKQICGIVPGLGGCQNFVYVFFFFFSGHSLWGQKKTHKQNSPQNPGTIPGKFCLRVLFFMCFFSLPTIPRVAPRVALRIGFSHKLGRECHPENCSENTRNSESCSENGPFHSESIFFKIGVVPRFLMNGRFFGWGVADFRGLSYLVGNMLASHWRFWTSSLLFVVACLLNRDCIKDRRGCSWALRSINA